MLGQRDSAFLVLGMILASVLDNFTTVFLVVLWLIINNEPLPDLLGGIKPQEIIGFFVRLVIRSKKAPVKAKNEDEVVVENWEDGNGINSNRTGPINNVMMGSSMGTPMIMGPGHSAPMLLGHQSGTPVIIYNGPPIGNMAGKQNKRNGNPAILPFNPMLVGSHNGHVEYQ